MEFIDITRRIEEGMPVYPGNPDPEISRYREIPEDSTTESRISIGSHTATHVDAPMHVFEDGKAVKDMDLDGFYGDAQVLDLTGQEVAVTKESLEDKEIESPIVLLKTQNSLKDFEDFDKDFVYLSIDAAEYLIDQGVDTVAIDYLSLVAFDGGDDAKKAHQISNKEMNVIEGVDLEDIEEKKYKFSGFPIKIDADGAPLRAVLIEE